MVHIETVDLSQRGIILPSNRVGVVIAQPHVPLGSLTPAEPYQCRVEVKPQQLAVLTKTLAVAQASPHGAQKTHFTIFPEYTIPGIEGVTLIDTTVRGGDWPNGTIVIGGTDALTHAQYAELIQGDATYVDLARNNADEVGPDRWVNCAITWVKAADGTVARWIQPKLHPAWEELNISHQHVFCGSSVYVFKGRFENEAPFRFATLVCFDWIATLEARTASQWILSDLHQQAEGNQIPLSWLFIIQRNKKPSHDAFLNGVIAFFNQTEFPNALRERACLVFANTAGKAVPGRIGEFGACSVVSSPQSLFVPPTCVPTFSKGGPRFRDGSTLLSNYKDVVFRERGACIHSFAQVNPGSLLAGPAGRSPAVEEAYVFPLSGTIDRRAPSAAVPAPVKWLNDELDEIPSLSSMYHAAPLAVQADAAHQTNVAALRAISAQSTTRAIKLAAKESKVEHADEWQVLESEALRHVVYTLDIISVGFPSPTMGADPAHATFLIDGQLVDVLAIRGTSHEDCIEYAKGFLPNPARQVLLVSRDDDNTAWHNRFGNFLQEAARRPGEERSITDPSSGTLHIGYQNLLEIFRGSATPAALIGGINAEFAA
jgi:hypothetical protein